MKAVTTVPKVRFKVWMVVSGGNHLQVKICHGIFATKVDAGRKRDWLNELMKEHDDEELYESCKSRVEPCVVQGRSRLRVAWDWIRGVGVRKYPVGREPTIVPARPKSGT